MMPEAVVKFNRNMLLEDQLDFPLQRDGLELVINDETDMFGYETGILTLENGDQVDLTHTESMHMALLMKYGYITNKEALDSVFVGVGSFQLVKNQTRGINNKVREKTGEKLVETKWGSPNHPPLGGCYIGQLRDKREEYEIVCDDYLLNILTGYFRTPDGKEAILNIPRTNVVGTIMRSRGSAHRDLLVRAIIENDLDEIEERHYSVLRDRIYRINTQIGQRCITTNRHQHYQLIDTA